MLAEDGGRWKEVYRWLFYGKKRAQPDRSFHVCVSLHIPLYLITIFPHLVIGELSLFLPRSKARNGNGSWLCVAVDIEVRFGRHALKLLVVDKIVGKGERRKVFPPVLGKYLEDVKIENKETLRVECFVYGCLVLRKNNFSFLNGIQCKYVLETLTPIFPPSLLPVLKLKARLLVRSFIYNARMHVNCGRHGF